MIKKLCYVIAEGTDPHVNLALEELLFHQVEEEMCILYLWQNRKTVVIGRNQNGFKECRYDMLQRDQGYLVRRLSGGGAVFHDFGNLNYTFLIRKKNYDMDRQFRVILRALGKLGIEAELTGRNDLTIESRKVSGSAFHVGGDCCYHHGTLMLSVNLEDLSKYLNVSREKLKSNGVDSVKSRVANIADYAEGLTVEQMRIALLEACEEEYGLRCEKYGDELLESGELLELERKYRSKEWTWGSNIKFTHQLKHKFPWGEVRMNFFVEQGIIKDVTVHTDDLQTEWPQIIKSKMKGCYFEEAFLCNRLDMIFQENLLSDWVWRDLKKMIRIAC